MPLARACCFAILAAAVSPQTPPPAATSAPPTASVVVRLPAGKATYHIGEEIPLELEFRGIADKEYAFSTMVGCGRFGRPPSNETVTVIPADGIEDPMADPFPASELGGVGYSCASGPSHPLDGTPFIFRASINDVVRFTRPGMYSLVVTSTRLGRSSLPPAPVLTSAPVDLTIVPGDDRWATTEIARAVALIDGGVLDDVRHGATLLRYLGTEGAMMALVDHYDVIEPVDGAIDTALILSPYRAPIVAGMEARVDAGERLGASFFTTLTRVRLRFEMSPEVKDFATRNARLNAISAEYDARWRAALARQPATASTLGAELARLADASPELQPQIAHDLEQHPAEAAEAFVALPRETQWLLLQSKTAWASLDRPWVLPALRQVYAQWHYTPMGSSWPAGDLALTHLYELAPDEGRRLILEEIKTGDRGIAYDTLAILPDATLPELDGALQNRCSSPRVTHDATSLCDRGTTAWLIARYGSPNLLPFVTSLPVRPTSCIIEGAQIAYLFKYDPASAMKQLDPGRDLASPGACDPLFTLAAHYWDDRVEAAAIAQLTNANIRRMTDAADALGTHGASAAKQPLLDRLGRWSEEWQGRATELEALRASRTSPSPEVLEQHLVYALFNDTQGVMRFGLTRNDVASIRALCVTDQCRTIVDGRASGIK